ncbi:hypothetical protein [Streptomyces sp. ME02-6978a]|nr:hypothetical protein [Streptomyces sp. ME02-6978a]MDX3092921.1 hypothetical protein [Streptomyces sp. ME12-02E]MDX3336291.1 hypothetical protein [Streptomyces sp. ME02-6978a]
MRWTMRTDPLVYGLIGHLVDDLGGPEEILTSLDRLADATGQDAIRRPSCPRGARAVREGRRARRECQTPVTPSDRVPC